MKNNNLIKNFIISAISLFLFSSNISLATSLPSNIQENIKEQKSNISQQNYKENNVLFNDFKWEEIYNKIDKKNIPKTHEQWYEELSKYYLNNSCVKNKCLFISEYSIKSEKIEGKEKISLTVFGYSFNKSEKFKIPSLVDNTGLIYKPLITSKENILIHKENNENYISLKENGKFNYELIYFVNNFESININSIYDIPIITNNTDYLLQKNDNNYLLVKNVEGQKNESIKNVENQKNEDKIDLYEIKIYRLLSEKLPYEIKTIIQINSVKENQKISLGKLIPKDFNVSNILLNKSTIKYENGTYYAIASLGSSSIEITALYNGNLKDLNIPTIEEQIVPAEIWSINQTHEFSGLNIKSKDPKKLVSIEPKETQTIQKNNKNIYLKVPEKWSNYDSYVLTDINYYFEQLSGNKEIPKNETLNTQRNTWIGFNKHIIESFNSQYTSTNINNEIQIFSDVTSAQINNNPIMVLEKEKIPYFKVQENNANILINTIIEDNSLVKKLKTNNTNIEDNKLNSWSVFLPSKNNIIFFSGAKSINDSWQSSWSLYAFFGLVIISFAFYRLFNYKIAIIAALSIIFNIQNNIISFNMWPAMLILMALLKTLSKDTKYENSTILKLTKISSAFIIFSLSLFAFAYTVKNIRTFINPSLEYMPGYNIGFRINDMISQEASLGAAPASAPMVNEMLTADIASSSAVPMSKVARSINESQKNITINEEVLTQTSKKQVSISNPKYIAKKYNIYLPKDEIKLYISPPWLTNIMIFINILFYWIVVYLFISLYFKYFTVNNKYLELLKNKQPKIIERFTNIV